MTTLISKPEGPVTPPSILSTPGQGLGKGEPDTGLGVLPEEDMVQPSAGGERSRGEEAGKLPQYQGPGPSDEHRGAAAAAPGAEGERSKDSPPRAQRTRPRPRQSPASPPPAYLYPPTAGGGGGAGAGARAGSLRPSVSGILAGNYSGDSSQQRHERAASLGDRYKGSHNIGFVRRQEQQQQQDHRCSNSGNRVYRAGERSAERFGERGGSAKRSSQQPQQAPSRGGGSYAGVSGASNADGSSAATASAAGMEMEDRRGSIIGGSAGRRRGREDGSRPGHDGRDEGQMAGEDGEQDQGQQGNGRVAQIAEGLLWVQKHPVLAAVIWMCGKVLDPGSEGNQQEPAAPTEGMATTTAEGRSEGAGGGGSGYDFEGSSNPMPGMSGEFEEGRTVPPGFWRRHSKGRLSWSDDYQGGCLAEYYEDERVARMASEASSVDADAPGQQRQDQRHQQSGSFGSKGTPAAGSGRPCCPGSRQHPHGHGNRTTAAGRSVTSSATRTGGGDGPRSDGCERCSGNVTQDGGDAAAAQGSAQGGANADEGGGRERDNDHYDDDGDHYDDGDEDDDEVFHSALQLAVGEDCGDGNDAEDVDDLEGVGGGCGPRVVQHDTFYGEMRDAMEDEGHGDGGGQTGGGEGGSGGGAAPSEDGRVSTSHKQAEAVSGPNDGNGAGTPNSAAGAGTWSPQWGWYVSMTPPQDQYPSQQNPIPGVKPPTPAAAAESSDAPTPIEGRPPRP